MCVCVCVYVCVCVCVYVCVCVVRGEGVKSQVWSVLIFPSSQVRCGYPFEMSNLRSRTRCHNNKVWNTQSVDQPCAGKFDSCQKAPTLVAVHLWSSISDLCCLKVLA